MHPNTQRGATIRAGISRVLARLAPGDTVPPIAAIARAARISKPRACRHLLRAMREAGVVARPDGRRGKVVVEVVR